MYELVLTTHSWVRWVALIAGVMAIVMAAVGHNRTDRWGLILVIALDLQFLLGFALYLVLSPNTKAIFDNFGAAMRDPTARYWAVEHVSLMMFAVVMAHVGRVLARKAKSPAAKRKRMLVCFVLSTIAMIAATPWPGMTSGRPLFRV